MGGGGNGPEQVKEPLSLGVGWVWRAELEPVWTLEAAMPLHTPVGVQGEPKLGCKSGAACRW